MRKIDSKVAEAVRDWHAFSEKNTLVEVIKLEKRSHMKVYLHGNVIGERVIDEARQRSWFRCSCCGWATQTTVARINGFLIGVGSDVHCRIRRGIVEFCRTGLSMSRGELATYVVSTGAYDSRDVRK